MADPLRDELLRPPAEGWRPKPGDVLIGEVVALAEREGFAGLRYPVVEVKTDEGDYVAIHAFHVVLRDELERQRPKVGDRLGVAYHGLVEKGESRYELYRVKVVRIDEHDPARAEPDWDAIRRDAEAEASRVAAPVVDETGADDQIPF